MPRISNKAPKSDAPWVDAFHPCQEKRLHSSLLIDAAREAIRINPANRPHVEQLRSVMRDNEDVHQPAFLAVLTTKTWPNKGVRLGVSFVETTTAALQNKILQHMNAWSAFCNVKFSLSSSGEVRISRRPGGYWSYLGTDVLHIPTNQQTMNLEGFTLNTPDSEYVRVVRHETGHTCGFPHEHLRDELVALLDVQKTIDYFSRTQGWSAQEVRDQVLTPLSQSSIRGTPHADQDSIMCYQIPGACTKSGQPIRGGSDIDALDQKFAADTYPPEIVTPPTPPVNPPVGVGQIVIDEALKTIYYPEPYTAQKR